jgi:SpoIIAA-like
MIQILADFPDDVLAISGVGKVSADDFRMVVIPALKDMRTRHERVSLYYELGPGFCGMTLGAAWEDTKIDLTNWRVWRRIALVSDAPWIINFIRQIVQLFHRRVRFFRNDQAESARAWIVEASRISQRPRSS